MADVVIPVKTQLDPRAFRELEREARKAAQEQARLARQQEQAARRAAQEQIRLTRQQINEHRSVQRLTRGLDKQLGPAKPSFRQEIGSAVGGQFLAANVLQSTLGGLKDFTVQSFQAANAAERLGAATDNLGRRFGTTGDAIVQAVQGASNYTIGQMAAMEAANKAMILGVGKSPQEFERLTRVATTLGRAMGQDANKSLDDLIEGLGKGSPELLNNIGIVVKAQTAYEKYAASIGKLPKDLTDAEKQQAIFNEAMEQGEKVIAGMDTATLSQADKVERLTARWSDFQIEFGKASQAMSESSGALDLLNAGIDRLIEGAQAWQGIAHHAEVVDLGMKKLNEDTTSWLNTLENIPVIGNTIQGLDMWGSIIVRNEELKKAMTEAGQELDAQKKAAEGAAAAALGNAEAMGEEADAADDLADRLERANNARRGAVRQMLEIEEQVTKDIEQTWEDYFEAEKDAWDDYGKEIANIQKDSAKEQESIQKDLSKSLADIDKKLSKDRTKLDRDLARDIAKERKNAAKEIERSEQDTARQERQQRRQRQIDAKADERLFQFEMRQLAAEGEFNRILEEKERRAIEQQIGAERQAEEDRAAQENSQIEQQRAQEDTEERIREMEEEAAIRRQEMEAQAEEARQLAQEEAAEAELRRQEELAQALADEQTSYQERLEAQRQHREERLAEIEAAKQEAIAKLAEELTESKDLTERELKALIPVAGELGEEVGKNFAEGLNAGFERNQRIDEMLEGQQGSSGLPGTQPGGRVPPGRGRTRRGFQHGGSFTVGGAGGIDSQLVEFMATPGERVTVQPQGQQGGQPVNITINAQGPGIKEFVAIIERKVNEGVNEYHETLSQWSRGE